VANFHGLNPKLYRDGFEGGFRIVLVGALLQLIVVPPFVILVFETEYLKTFVLDVLFVCNEYGPSFYEAHSLYFHLFVVVLRSTVLSIDWLYVNLYLMHTIMYIGFSLRNLQKLKYW